VISNRIHTSHYAKKDILLRDGKSSSRLAMAVLASSRPPLLIARDKRLVGLGDLNTTGSTKGLLDVTVDGELTSSQGTNHEETGTDTTE